MKLWNQAKLPNNHLVRNSFNKGIGINQFEARTLLFDEIQYDRVMFFEDDLVPNRNYVRLLQVMLDQFQNEPRVGIVMCHGGLPRNFSDAERRLFIRRVRPGNDHLWGWATWRNRWLTIKQDFLEYYTFIKDLDYKRRSVNQAKILSFYKKHGFEVKITSQDAAIYYCLVKRDLISVQTVIHRGKYIGAKGEHMSPERYSTMGYSALQIRDYPEDLCLDNFDGYDEDMFLSYSQAIFPAVPI